MASQLSQIRKLLKTHKGARQALALLQSVGDEAIYESLLKTVKIDQQRSETGLTFGSTFPKDDDLTVLRLIAMATGPRATHLKRTLSHLKLSCEEGTDLSFLESFSLRKLTLISAKNPTGLDRIPALESLRLIRCDLSLEDLTGPVQALSITDCVLDALNLHRLHRLQITTLNLDFDPFPPGEWTGLCLEHLVCGASPHLRGLESVEHLHIRAVDELSVLTNISIRKLWLEDPSVTSLDGLPESIEDLFVSRGKALVDISAIERLPNLRKLNLSDCRQVTDLKSIYERERRLDEFTARGLGAALPELPASEHPSSLKRARSFGAEDTDLQRRFLEDGSPYVSGYAAKYLADAGEWEALFASNSRAAWWHFKRADRSLTAERLLTALSKEDLHHSALAWLALSPDAGETTRSPALLATIQALPPSPLRSLALAPPRPETPQPPLPTVTPEDGRSGIYSQTKPPDLTEMRGAADLVQLYIGCFMRMRYSTWGDAEVFPRMPRLQVMHILSRRLTTLRSMSHLSALLELKVQQNKKLVSLDGAQNLTKLQTLEMSHTSVADLSPLRGLPLRRLHAHHTKIKDLQPLSTLSQLSFLSAYKTGIKTLAPIARLPLRALNIGQTGVKDLSPLRGMLTLERLDLSSSEHIEDFSVLPSLRRLKVLALCKIPFRDIELLFQLPSLTWVNLNGTGMEDHPLVPQLDTLLRARGGEVQTSINVDTLKYASDLKRWDEVPYRL